MKGATRNRTPYMPFYVGDFLGATTLWEGEEKAVYALLLTIQWSNGPLPDDPARISKAIGYDTSRFLKLWKTVGKKFTPTSEGLVNERLEEVRSEVHELSAVRSQAGSAGGRASAASRAKSPVARSKPPPNVEANVQPNVEAKVVAKDQPNRPAKDQAREVASPPNLLQQNSTIQTKPNQEEQINPTSPPAQRTSNARARGTLPPDHSTKLSDEEFRERLQSLKTAYPDGTYAESDWLLAERDIRDRLEDGFAWEDFIAGCERYSAQLTAKGKVGTQFVYSPKSFFTRREHRFTDPFPLPITKADQRLNSNLDAVEQARREIFGSKS